MISSLNSYKHSRGEDYNNLHKIWAEPDYINSEYNEKVYKYKNELIN